METEVTTSAGPAPAVVGGAEADEVFGTRPTTDRPHSMSLHASAVIGSHPGAPRGMEVLLGVAAGAAAMYYLDPEAGARRRARLREAIVDVASLAPDVFETAARDVTVRATRLAADARLQAKSEAPTAARADGSSRRSTSSHLVATTLASVLTLLAARRRDPLGTAVALIGSTLLARGIGGARAPRREWAISEEALEPTGGELRDPF